MVYYGKMNCYNDYENYIDIVKYVFRDYKREFPLIINTMGWVSGICRGIDMDKRTYHILTPLPPEELKTVNCLLVGSISIPHCIFQNQPGPEGSVPYVTTDYNLNIPGATEKIGEREYGKAFPRHKLRQRRK